MHGALFATALYFFSALAAPLHPVPLVCTHLTCFWGFHLHLHWMQEQPLLTDHLQATPTQTLDIHYLNAQKHSAGDTWHLLMHKEITLELTD